MRRGGARFGTASQRKVLPTWGKQFMQRIPPLSRFEESPFRRMLIDWLRDVPIGEIATYKDLSEIVGDDIRRAWHLLSSAREVLLKEGLVFDVVVNVGLKRLDDIGKVAAAEGYLDKSRNAARRTNRVLRVTDYAALSDADRLRYNIADIRAGAVQMFASKRGIRQIVAAAESGSALRQLKGAVRDTFKQFGE